MGKDYYKILNLDKKATTEEIKNAYYKYAKEYHPDKNIHNESEANNKFKEISEAYGVLGNKSKKESYDKQSNFTRTYYTETFTNKYNNNNNNYYSNYNSNNNYNNNYSNNNQTETKKNNEKIYYDLNCTLEDLYNFKIKEIKINRRYQNPKNKIVTNKKETIKVELKPWYKDGTKITFKNKGDDLISQPKQDLVYTLKQEKHNRFIREKDDLRCNIELSLVESLIGFKKFIKTLDNELFELKIEEISKPGGNYILKNKGMKTKDGSYGNLIINYIIKYPEVLTLEQKNILNQLDL